MLVLSRQRDETIMIGDDIEITVVDIRGDKVRLGINAPRQIQVHRKEVYDAIKLENTNAVDVQADDLDAANSNLRRLNRSRPNRPQHRDTPRSDDQPHEDQSRGTGPNARR